MNQAELAVLQLYKKALDMSGCVAILNSTGKVIFVNETFCKVFEITSSDVVGKLYTDIEFITDPLIIKQMHRSLLTGDPWNGDIQYSKKDHSTVWMESRIGPVKNSAGGIAEIIWMQFDSTKRRKSDDLLFQTQKVSLTGGWDFDVIKQELTWTPVMFDLHDVDSKIYKPEMVTALDFFLPKYRGLVEEAFIEACVTGKEFTIDAQMLTAKEILVWVKMVGVPQKNDIGEVVRVYGTFQNIDKEIENHQKILENQKKLQQHLHFQKQISLFSGLLKDISDIRISTSSSLRILLKALNISNFAIYEKIHFRSEDMLKKVFEEYFDRPIGVSSFPVSKFFQNSKQGVVQFEIDINKATGEIKQFMTDAGIKTLLVFPIMVSGNFWGALVAADFDKVKKFRDFEIEGIELCADIYGTFFEDIINKEKIIHEQQRFLDVVDSSGDYIYEIDPKGGFTYLSPKFLPIINKTSIEDLSIFSLANGTQSHNENLELLTFIRGLESFKNQTFHMLDAKGNVLIMRITGAPFYDKNQKFIGYRGIITDTTEKVLQQIELDSNKERLNLSVLASGLGIWDLNFETNVLIWDGMMKAIHKVNSDNDISFDEWMSYINYSDQEVIRAKIEMIVEGHSHLDGRYRLQEHDIWVEIKADVYYKEDGTTPKRILGTCKDITEAKRKEEANWKLTEYQKAVLNSSNYAIIATDNFGRINIFNKAAEKILGYKIDDVLGRENIDKFFDFEQVDEYILNKKQVGSSKEEIADLKTFDKIKRLDNVEAEFSIKSKTSILPMMLSMTVLRNNRFEVSGFLCIAQDLTRTKELEQNLEDEKLKTLQSSKLATLGEMASGVAHEINNPLAIIDGHCQKLNKLVQRNELTADKVQLVADKIKNTADRIARIVKGLKNFSRDASRDEFRVETCIDLFDDTLSLCEERFRNVGLNLIVENPAPEFKINCRKTELSQVLLNLLNNASDAIMMAKCEIKEIKLSASVVDNLLQIRVTDSGPGIPEDAKAKIFQPFYTTKEIGKGTGLGLSLSTGIVKNHKGRLFLDSESEKTCFVVELPLSITDQNTPDQDPEVDKKEAA